MGKVPGTGTRVYLAEFNLSGFGTAFVLGIEQVNPASAAMSDVGPRRVPAEYDWTGDLTSLFDGVDDQLDEIFDNVRLGTSGQLAAQPLLYAPAGDAVGDVAYEGLVSVNATPFQSRRNEVAMLNGQFEGRAGISRGEVNFNASVSGTGAQTSRNPGASAVDIEKQVVARVISGTFTVLDFDIQESSDDGGGDAFADVVGWDFAFTAAGFLRKTITIAHEAWLRVNVDAFTGTSALLLVTIGDIAGSP